MNRVQYALLSLFADAQFGSFAIDGYAEAAKKDASLSIPVDGPTGQRLRLDYSDNGGWRVSRARSSNASDVSAHPVAMESERTDSDSAPLAVYVDGPSGFAYVWSRDNGWKFVGHVAR